MLCRLLRSLTALAMPTLSCTIAASSALTPRNWFAPSTLDPADCNRFVVRFFDSVSFRALRLIDLRMIRACATGGAGALPPGPHRVLRYREPANTDDFGGAITPLGTVRSAPAVSGRRWMAARKMGGVAWGL